MRKTTAAFFLVILVLSVFSGISLYPQSRGLRSRVKKLDSDNEVGKQYLVLIAINRYQHWTPLKGPVKDAEDIRKVLESRYYIDEVLKLYDEEATKRRIIKLLKLLQKKIKQEDSVLIFYAGHGHLHEASGIGHWIAVNGGLDENKMENWISNAMIRGLISKMKSKHIFLISDSCFSGNLLEASRDKRPKLDNDFFRKAYMRRSRQALTSGASERVPDNSKFAQQLKLALQENNKPYLTPLSIYDKIRWGIKDTFPMFGDIQGTNHQKGGAFLLFLKEDGKGPLRIETGGVSIQSKKIRHPFKFPKMIEYKILRKGKVMGSSIFYYTEKGKFEGTSSLKLINFEGLGFTSKEHLITYIFDKDFSIYTDFLLLGKKVISEVRLKPGFVGFDGKKSVDYAFREYDTSNVIQKEHVVEHKVINFLSSFLIASKRVSSGNYQVKRKFNLIIHKRMPVVEMEYRGDEGVTFHGKTVPAKILAFVKGNRDIWRMSICKENRGYCFPIRIVFDANQENSFEMRADKISPSPCFDNNSQNRLFITNLSFMDAQTYSTMSRRDFERSLNEAVEEGMTNAQKLMNNILKVNDQCHKITNTEISTNELVNITFDPNLTKKQKIEQIINRLMSPFGVDGIVTGQYIEEAKNPIISIRPILIVKSTQEILLINLQFTKEELLCEDPISKKEILCKDAFDQIVQSVEELLGELQINYWKNFGGEEI